MVVFSEFPEIMKSMNGIFSNVNSPMIFSSNLWQRPPLFCWQMTRMKTSQIVTENHRNSWSHSMYPAIVVGPFCPSREESHIFCQQNCSKSCAGESINMLWQSFRSTVMSVARTHHLKDLGKAEFSPFLRPVLSGRNTEEDLTQSW